MSLRPSRPLAGVTASQLWANSLENGIEFENSENPDAARHPLENGARAPHYAM